MLYWEVWKTITCTITTGVRHFCRHAELWNARFKIREETIMALIQ
jgi:hypothetical protein